MSPLEQYARQIRQILSGLQDFKPQAESPSGIQVERGAVFAKTLLDPDFRVSLPNLTATQRIIDRNGHSRPIYRPLLGYALLQAHPVAPAWIIPMRQEVEQFIWPPKVLPADQAEPAALACWNALCLQIAGLDSAKKIFDQLIARQQKNGGFLLARPADSPDMRWYHELLLLHALASYAAQSDDPFAEVAVQRNAIFHLEESQPDHATNQPWGLFAFIRVAEARPLADQLLHTLQTQHPQGISGIAAILLADALLCLQRVLNRRP